MSLKEIEGLGIALAEIESEPYAQRRHELCSKLLGLLYPTIGTVLIQGDDRPDGISDVLVTVGELLPNRSCKLTRKGRAFVDAQG